MPGGIGGASVDLSGPTALGAQEAASPRGDRAPRLRLTLRAIGVLAIAGLAIYLALVGAYVAHERAQLFHIVRQLEHSHAQHELLTQVGTALTHSVVSLQDMLNTQGISGDHIDVDFALFLPKLPALRASSPATAPAIDRLERQYAQVAKDRSLANVTALRDSGQELAAKVGEAVDLGHRQEEGLYDEYRRLNQQIATLMPALYLFGLAAFGTAVIWFFFRLAADIKALEARATAIVGGYRGAPLVVKRRDELGSLMDAVNRAQSELRKWEQQEEISRQKRFHQEKMAAIGSLAAAVAHEVSNPINSISGIAQYTIDALRSPRRLDDSTFIANAELTLKQTERVAALLRRLADLAGPHSARAETTNVNELVESTCSLLRYDRRFRHIALEIDVARDVPAVRAVSDHLVQVIMNLLINAADATEGVTGRAALIQVRTRHADGEVVLSVSDNGDGMDSAVLARAFTDSFTTKPAGKGRGIGLYLCKKLIEEMAGRISLRSARGAGTTARVCLPAVPTSEANPSGTLARDP